MTIGKPFTPFTHLQPRGNDTRELDNFFRTKKKDNLRMIVVVIPEMKGPYCE